MSVGRSRRKLRLDPRLNMRNVATLSVLLVIVSTTSCMWVPRESEPESVPNILLLVADDLGWRDVGFMGSTFYRTPELDRLAAEGMVFSSAYAASSVCSPTRAALLSGRWPAAVGVTDWIPGMRAEDRPLHHVEDRDHLPHGVETLPERLQAAGYVTGHVGKWHLGGDGSMPEDHGYSWSMAGDHRGAPPTYFWPYGSEDDRVPDLYEGGGPGEYLTDRIGREAAEFIERHRGEPFFLHVDFYAVHLPLEAPAGRAASYEERSTDGAPVRAIEEGLRDRLAQTDPVYAAMVETLDRNVGRILDAVDSNGLTNRTLVVFTSDNGGLSRLLASRSVPPTSNAPLRAGKGWLYEGGIRVPQIVRWPGRIPAGEQTPRPTSTMDLTATMLDAAGLPPGEVAGRSLLSPSDDEHVPRTLYWHYPHYHGSGAAPSGAVRRGSFKLIEFFEDGRLELYNVERDVGERENLAAEMPDTVQALHEALRRWRLAVSAQMPERRESGND